ncbi:hypothetical protein KHS38_21330 [Mucilaginibacter sp. Bleaf8]|uniref:hypothetical protein n=1 Tax=Mucilaginibacter sp. Bleaf8 TaxID=2834430 RepID=UPI001BD179C2|nr:hypothetical protein [Mucilaginibacter sp. Bleaf8]MBS7566961.1 hypothetical protein [Mucilaginibacter sp. Bleaf8]
MSSQKQLSITYNFLIDTLIMASSNFKTLNDEQVEDHLEELEGDAHSFFDYNAVYPLRAAGLICQFQLEQITNLKAIISKISEKLWHKQAFRSNIEWIEVHEAADKILSSLNVQPL